MAVFAEKIIKLPAGLHSLYYRVIEETDNGVLYDQYESRKKAHEAEKEERKTKPKHKVRAPGS